MNDFYINEKHIIYVILAILFIFFIPIILVAKNKKLLEKINFKSLIIVLNKSFYFQVIIGIFLLLIVYLIQKTIYVSQSGFDLLIIEISFSFILIMILYLPIIGVLNLIKLLKNN
jgi:hypothetical protein